jgi:DNA-binding PadR family transcriptional regulator
VARSGSEPMPEGSSELRGPSKLPATAWAVLGLLSFGRPLSGYDLKKWADAILTFFYWSPALSQIYGELKRLERLGYVSSDVVRLDELRRKRVYSITEAGRHALAEWVQGAPVEPPVLKHGVLLRVWLGHLADPGMLRSLVEEHRDLSARLAAKAARSRTAAHEVPDWSYPELVARWSERYYLAERDLADQLLDELDRVAGLRARRRRS